MAVLQALATFAVLLSLASAGTLTCDQRLQPLNIDDYTAMSGKWIIHALAVSDKLKSDTASLKSSWMKLSVDDQGQVNNVRWNDKINADCVPGSGSVTRSGNEMSLTYDSKTHKGVYLQTCPACLLYTDAPEAGAGHDFMFLAKRVGSAVEASEMETFRKQAECQNVPNVILLIDELCPDQ